MDIDNANLQQLEKGGNKMQYKSQEALKRIQSKLYQTEELGDGMLVELQKQNEQFLRIDMKLQNVDNAGSRAQKVTRYFQRELMADKQVMGLGCCIAILLLLLVVGWFLPDKNV